MKRPVGPPVAEPIHHGRPKNLKPSSSVTTWLPAHEHDQLIRRARVEDTSVSALVRRLLNLRPR